MIKYFNKFATCLVLALLASAFVFTSCKKDDDDNNKGAESGDEYIDYEGTVVSHFMSLSFRGADGFDHAAYTKDLDVFVLDSLSVNSYANAIFVDGNDVYVAGCEDNTAVYWKNGAIHYLPEGTVASSITVKNGHVYACGYESTYFGDEARYWVDDTPAYPLKNGTRAEDIDVDDNGNIYIVGYKSEKTDAESLYYWVGAVGTMSGFKLNADAAENACEGRGIALDYTHYDDSGNPYICIASTEYASRGSMCKQWINRRAYMLDQTSGNDLFDIKCSKGKLYTCGNIARKAVYWESTINSNGRSDNVVVHALSDGSKMTYATALSVLEGHVYVVGWRADYGAFFIWKDGVDATKSMAPFRLMQFDNVEISDIAVVRLKKI